jgi:hypothetical protein
MYLFCYTFKVPKLKFHFFALYFRLSKDEDENEEVEELIAGNPQMQRKSWSLFGIFIAIYLSVYGLIQLSYFAMCWLFSARVETSHLLELIHTLLLTLCYRIFGWVVQYLHRLNFFKA